MVSSSVDAGLASHEKPITLNMLASRSPNMAGGEEFAGYQAKNLRPGRFTGKIVKNNKTCADTVAGRTFVSNAASNFRPPPSERRRRGGGS